MHTLHIYFFLINTICIFISNGGISISNNRQQLIIRGRITFPSNSRMSIESGARLTVELQDTSFADAPVKVIAKGTGTAVRFPIAFAIRYLPSQVASGFTYSLRVTIINRNNELLYTNDVYTPIVPLGVSRTKFIDVPVIRVKQINFVSNKSQWPELLGTRGEYAVQIIIRETGFTNVVIVKQGSAVTLDYRTDRVRVFVDDYGIVISIPAIG